MSKKLQREALRECGEELERLREFKAIDYQKVERERGRGDGKGIELDGEPYGSVCYECPVWKELGKCTIRDSFQKLAEKQRGQFELVRPTIGTKAPEPGDVGGMKDAGWYQPG